MGPTAKFESTNPEGGEQIGVGKTIYIYKYIAQII